MRQIENRPGAALGQKAGAALLRRPWRPMDDDLQYVSCPRCHQRVREPFLPAEATYRVAVIHSRRGRASCRLLVTVHPSGRTEVEGVPEDVSLEDALKKAVA